MNSIPPAFPHSDSGFEVLARTRFGRSVCAMWILVNDFVRHFLPIFHLAMLVVVGIILFGVVFANQHLPTWYDETCLTDPAFYKATQGVWRSRMEIDSLSVEPFAVKYPLLIGTMWVLTKLLGMHFGVFRASMLFFGLAPVLGLLWLARKRGLLQSWTEVVQAAYFLACFGLFYWAIYIRPEAMVLSIGFFLVLFWLDGRTIPLFLTALCIPLCGLHWNVLVSPAILAWLFFGGPARNPLVVIGGALLGSIAVLAWYHLAGMWPSYILEAHRLTSPHIVDNVRSFVVETFLNVRLDRFLFDYHFPFNAFLCVLLMFGLGFIAFLTDSQAASADKKHFLFVLLSLSSLVLALASAAWLNDHYTRLLVPLSCLWAPLIFRRWWSKSPLLLVLMTVFAAAVAYPLWNYTCHSKEGGARTSLWMDEAFLEKAIGNVIPGEEIILADTSAYFAVRSQGNELFPLCYAFDLSKEQIRSCSAVLVEDNPSQIFNRDYSDVRNTSYSKAMKDFLFLSTLSGDIWDVRISPDDLISAIAAHWQCTFTEIPLDFSSARAGAIRYRLFRPVFSAEPA